ncbi:hypothetical protein, partial [Sphingomonas sp. 2378]|uniref:hypothetical protein n=1 Tax=Sphingomonas sp. 2378 TaxID=1219748 RepID=UPI00311AFBAF
SSKAALTSPGSLRRASPTGDGEVAWVVGGDARRLIGRAWQVQRDAVAGGAREFSRSACVIGSPCQVDKKEASFRRLAVYRRLVDGVPDFPSQNGGFGKWQSGTDFENAHARGIRWTTRLNRNPTSGSFVGSDRPIN